MSKSNGGGAGAHRWGAEPATWRHFAKLTPLVLPVVSNPNAKISPRSTIPESNKGKVPSHYDGNREIVGIEGWPDLNANIGLIKKYMRDEPDYGICIVTKEVRAIDVDITDAEVSPIIRALIESHFGRLPIRRRSNSLKFLATITLPGDYAKRVVVIGDGKVEFLATGQQFIAAGTHPSGVPYEWENGLPVSFPVVSPEAFEAFWTELVSLYGDPADSMPRPKETCGPATPTGANLADIRALLARIIPAGLEYDDWLLVGFALHHETRGAPVGQDLWEQWSFAEGKNKKHNEANANFDGRYNSFRLDHENPVTLRSLERLTSTSEDMSSEWEEVNDDDTTVGVLRVTPVGLAALDRVPAEPDIIVDSLILQDACGFVAPGGTGKTTLAIYEAVHIILGRTLWGRAIIKPGAVLFLTAEDSRQIVETRLNHIVAALALTPDERALVGSDFYIEDLSLVSARLVGIDSKGRIRTSKLLTEIIDGYKHRGLSLVHLDPASLLGPGEQSGNDGMSELMRAGRRISIETKAACQIVHHVSQQVARGGIQDQYAGRGGTSFADNSRGQRQLVTVKKRLFIFDDRKYRLPVSVSDDELADGEVLAILVHKLSYVKLNRHPIFIRRRGFSFEHIEAELLGSAGEASVDEDMEAVARFLDTELANDHRHSPNSVELHSKTMGLAMSRIRSLIKEGLAIGRFELAELSLAERRGSKTHYVITTELENADLSTR